MIEGSTYSVHGLRAIEDKASHRSCEHFLNDESKFMFQCRGVQTRGTSCSTDFQGNQVNKGYINLSKRIRWGSGGGAMFPTLFQCFFDD